MPKKKDKERAKLKEKEDASIEEKDNEISIKSQGKAQVDIMEDTERDIIREKMDAEPELLEEKGGAEPKLLEFYSKDELIKQLKEFEKDVKDKDDKIIELNGWKNKYVHLQAEFENANKRWDKNRQNLRTQYTASVIKNFLPLYDSFKKAIDSNSKDSETLSQFFNQFLSILKFQGAEPIEVKKNDQFDYNKHEALTTIENDDIPENSIIDIIQEGWKIGKDILRYAKVVISKKPKPPEPEPEPAPETETESEEIKISDENEEKEKDSDAQTKNDNSDSKKNEYIS